MTETLGFLERDASVRGVELCTDFAKDLPPLVSDRGQLQQVVLNIAGTALAAVGHGGKVHISAKVEWQHMLLEVEDNGKGMNATTLKHIFEPFYTTKKDKGTGLGMFITYGIVRRLGGSISVHSEEDKGTRVLVRLPLTPHEDVAPTPPEDKA